jgi:D-alanyl-D-alanine carboxypeptidase
VSPLLLAPTSAAKPADVATTAAEAQAKAILNGLEAGKLDRSLFTDDGNFYFSPEAIGDFQNSLTPLGSVTAVTQRVEELRGGMTFRVFTIQFSNRSLRLTTYTMPDGKLEQFLVGP